MSRLYLYIAALIFLLSLQKISAQSIIGKWKKVAHTIDYAGKKMDSYKVLLQQYPVAERLLYVFDETGNFQLQCQANDCQEKYVHTQKKLYAKTKWRLTGNELMLSASNFSVGQRYTIRFVGKKMIWEGTEGQGTIIYEKIQ